MSLLLCAATRFEIAPTLTFIQEQQWQQKVTVLISGVGMPATLYQITKAIMQQPPRLIIQAGVAGSFDTDFPLTEVVAVERDTFGDLGVQENGMFHTLFDLKLTPSDEKPWQENWLINPHNTLLQRSGLVEVAACSVNEITTTEHRIHHYRQMGAQLETMEGAALHYVALMEQIPFLQVRSISNYAGERDKSKWAMQEAIARLNETLQHIILINTEA